MLSLCKRNFAKAIFSGLLITSLHSASAQTAPLLAVGNVVVRPEALERIIRKTVAEQLGANTANNSLSFVIPEIQQTVVVPETTGMLKSILDILGITDKFPLTVSPVKANFSLPASAMVIDIQNRAANTFAIRAKLSLNTLSATADALSIQLPNTLFGQSAEITSSDLEIGLAKGSVPVQMEIDLLATLDSGGAKFKLQGFHTNLASARHPEFSLTLGKLTINNAPLSLQIAQAGEPAFTADEPTIRSELQKLESTYIETIRPQIVTMLQAQVATLAKSIQAQEPLKYDVKSSSLIAEAGVSDKNLQKLLSGIELSGVVSYLQMVQSSNVYSAQISSPICLDGQCLSSSIATSPIGSEDLSLMQASDDAGAILYESFVQDLVNSAPFQKRISDYYKTTGTTPGVNLAPSGVKVFVDPSSDSIIAILNLEINIEQTAVAGVNLATSNWKNWVTQFTNEGEGILERDVGAVLERTFGSGKVVKIPVAISIKIDGLEKDSQGVNNLVLHFDLPSFAANGTFVPSPLCSAQDCPNNIPKMTSEVRASFLSSVKQEVMKVIPTDEKIPLNPMTFTGLTFQAKNIAVTANHGLLITADISDTTSGVGP